MALPKIGLNYFSIETDRYQDMKIKRLKKDFSCSGLAVYDYILCEIYRVKGCYIEWDENTAFDVSDYFGIKESLVNEIVNYCCAVGLFNKALLTRERILTSSAIQKRYLAFCLLAKRTNCEVPKRVIIQEECDIIQEESPIIPEECAIPQEVCPEEKRREVKGKEVNNTKAIFEIFRKSYLGTKGGLEIEFQNFIKKNSPDTVDLLLPALEKEKSHRAKSKELKMFVPEWKILSTWINKKCWEQEFPDIGPPGMEDVKSYSWAELMKIVTTNNHTQNYEPVNINGEKRWVDKRLLINA